MVGAHEYLTWFTWSDHAPFRYSLPSVG